MTRTGKYAVDDERIGAIFRQARKEQHITQGELGQMLTKPRSYAAISDIERGKTAITVNLLAEMTRLLGLDIIRVWVGTEPPQ